LIGHDPRKVLRQLHKTVIAQQAEFDRIYGKLIAELKREGVCFVDENQLTLSQANSVREYFHNVVRAKLFPIMFDPESSIPDLKDRSIYLAVCLFSRRRRKKSQYALIEIPSDILPRFHVLSRNDDRQYIIMLDDIIRLNLPEIFAAFDYTAFKAYTIKLTRDAELDIDDDISESYIQKIDKSIKQRKQGRPVRLVYDSSMPRELLRLLIKKLRLGKNDPIIPGSRYHNFKDFMKFAAAGRNHLRYPPFVPIPNPDIIGHKSMFAAIRKRDIFLSFPYHSFGHIIDLLREASIDPDVISIKISLYRLASNSAVANALINAVKNGKSVTVVVELQARFDEQANIYWANQLKEAGARVIFGVPGLKMHAKICLISRRVKKTTSYFAAIGTGNFNEETAGLYSDHFLLTADPRVTNELVKVFEFLENAYKTSTYKYLLVSPLNMRKRLNRMIHTEIRNARSGKKAYIWLKLNHLTDPAMIRELYKASQDGVEIKLIIRGMFSLIPGVKGLSENIQAIGILDRWLEHSRMAIFANGGNELCYILSADWMPRNLDRRVEIGCPILDKSIKAELKTFFKLQWQDNTKARILNDRLDNQFRRRNGLRPKNAQSDVYAYLKKALVTKKRKALR
jgi:polyphosphate kinase